MSHHNTIRWEKEHYDLLYTSKTCDECCADFQKKFPKMKLSSIFSHWNHKKQYRKDYEKLLANEDKIISIVLTFDEKVKKLREILLSLNLRDGQDIPWVILTRAAKDIFSTEGTVRAVILGHGNYKKRKTAKCFRDIVSTSEKGTKIFRKPEQSFTHPNQILCPDCKNILFKHQGQLKCNKCGYVRIDKFNQNLGLHTITVKTKAITEPIKNERIAAVIDDDTLKLWKYRSLRAEQVQLMKEVVNVNKDILSAINKNTEAVTKMVQGIEEARSADAKRKTETLAQPVVA